MKKSTPAPAAKKDLTSSPTKVASSIFFVLGLFTFNDSLSSLQGLTNQTELKIVYAIAIFWGIISIITSNYLWKAKKWAYILAFVLIAAQFGLNTYTYYRFEMLLNVINLAVGAVTLILLIVGRKDFVK